MAKKLNYADMAAAIITQLGTQENLTNVNHCATRLRVVDVYKRQHGALPRAG